MTYSKEILDRIFHPKSVAIVGASDNLFKMGHRCVLSLVEIGFEGQIYPINNKVESICGLRTYPTLTDVPGEVDLAIIVVPALYVPEALKAAAEKHAAGAVITTAGFKEIEDSDGSALQAEITRIANEAGIKIIGPNTFGMVNIGAKLNASFTPPFSHIKRGTISMLGQSGGVCHLVGFQAIDENVGMNKIVGLGNRCNLSFPALIDYLGDDPETRTIIVYLEGIEEPRAFMEAARRVTRRKPMVGFKVGQSEAASRAVQSHTGSLSGKHSLYYASFEQAGIVPAQDTVELLDIAKILDIAPRPAGNRVAVMSFQAGPGIMLTDLCVNQGLEMTQFSADTVAGLKKLWPDLTIRSNPVDLAFVSDMEVFGKAARLVLEDANVDAVIVFYLDVMSFFTAAISEQLIPLAREVEKPIVLCVNFPARLSNPATEEGLARFHENGIATYPLPERAVKALKGLMRRAEVERRLK
ncbi:MAG: CoA-binding protein [Candidatus Lindowbacteria bacterium]|nr:CoA-binding protein [Candidatus Lindowbacteria bacterium]